MSSPIRGKGARLENDGNKGVTFKFTTGRVIHDPILIGLTVPSPKLPNTEHGLALHTTSMTSVPQRIDRHLSPWEKVELADFMIQLWDDYRAGALEHLNLDDDGPPTTWDRFATRLRQHARYLERPKDCTDEDRACAWALEKVAQCLSEASSVGRDKRFYPTEDEKKGEDDE